MEKFILRLVKMVVSEASTNQSKTASTVVPVFSQFAKVRESVCSPHGQNKIWTADCGLRTKYKMRTPD